MCAQDVVLRVAAGQDVGTLVDPAAAEAAGGSKAAATASSARDMAVRARAASRQLQVRGCVDGVLWAYCPCWAPCGWDESDGDGGVARLVIYEEKERCGE